MLNTLDKLYIGAKIRMNNFVDEFKKDQTGVSSIVATVLLILIVVLLVSIFWGKLQEWFDYLWGIITGTANKIPGAAAE